MSEKKVAKPIALAVGIALAGSFAAVEAAQADTGASPFAMTTLSVAYMLGEGEGSCGGDKGDEAEGSCGGDKEGDAEEQGDAEGSCGGDKEGDAEEQGDAEGSCGGDKEGEAEDKGEEGSCGEGKCGGDA
jgi:uncharacterized low-complexity protein